MESTKKESKMTLLEKLGAITSEFGAATKGGTNTHQGYSYVRAEDVVKQFRQLEVKYKVKLLISADPTTLRIDNNGKGNLTTVVIKYEIRDLESPDVYTVTLPSQGYDSTDKGVFKALTGGLKYFLLQTFSFSSDDPEVDSGESDTTSIPDVRFKVPSVVNTPSTTNTETKTTTLEKPKFKAAGSLFKKA